MAVTQLATLVPPVYPARALPMTCQEPVAVARSGQKWPGTNYSELGVVLHVSPGANQGSMAGYWYGWLLLWLVTVVLGTSDGRNLLDWPHHGVTGTSLQMLHIAHSQLPYNGILKNCYCNIPIQTKCIS